MLRNQKIKLKTNYFLVLFTFLSLLLSCNIVDSNQNVIVTFDSNGGSTVKSQTIEKGSTATKPTPTKKDYVFHSWHTHKTLTTPFDFTTSINSNITLYAKWKEQPVTKTALISLMTPAIVANPNTNLNHIDTSLITNMSQLFKNKNTFNGDISSWDTSQVTNMKEMFANAANFNQPIGNWNTSKVISMQDMFSHATNFNQPINNWDTSRVVYMDGMFLNAQNFNQDISSWITSQVINMNSTFANATNFNQDISSWNTAKVVSMYRMFYDAKAFDQNLESWNVSAATSKGDIFTGSPMENKKPSWCSTGSC